MTERTVGQHFDGKAAIVRAVYDRLLKAFGRFGAFEEDPKKTSITWSAAPHVPESPQEGTR